MRTKKTRMYRLRVKEIAESKGISRTKLARLTEMQYESINGMWNNPYLISSVGLPDTDQNYPPHFASSELRLRASESACLLIVLLF